ncbi:maker505 [Drosophila busckii]|uniref:Proteasome subunit beta n=1 Tax=Drosophila busckii TaxID=30019 RepID=A0A0M3QTX2_DROBS|nr:maker505 [Drosophila busckii]
MALEKLCGLDILPFMRTAFDTRRAQLELNVASCNFNNPYMLLAPPFAKPKRTLKRLLKRKNLKLNATHGTTTVGIKFKGGIVLGADSRGTNGTCVASQKLKKIMQINEYMLATMAGAAADCNYWDRVLEMEARLYRVKHGQQMPINTASRILSNVTSKYKGMGLSMGMMLAGYDPEGPRLIYIDSDGLRTEGNSFTVGSGSGFAHGVLDSDYRWDMSDSEAYRLARRCIFHAACLDA